MDRRAFQPETLNRLREIPLDYELDRIERELKFSSDPAIRTLARRRYLELTDKDFGQ